MSLPEEVRAQYVAIIDSILADADLTTISVKQVRNGIQTRVQYDITPHKQAINELVHDRFSVAETKLNGNGVEAEKPVPSVESEPHTNGFHKSKTKSESSAASASQRSSPLKREASSEDMSDVVDNAPPKKKRKAGVEDDATLAARLQLEEDQGSRPTRGAATRKAQPKKKRTPKKKSKARVDGSTDSEVDDGEPKKPKSNTGFHKPLNLSPQLSALLDGELQLSRPEVTKRLWKHIKGNDLQDPADKRYILCDGPMREVFRQDKVHMFTMTKLVSQQMYNPEE